MKQVKTTISTINAFMLCFDSFDMSKQNSLFLKTVNIQNHTAVFDADGGLF